MKLRIHPNIERTTDLVLLFKGRISDVFFKCVLILIVALGINTRVSAQISAIVEIEGKTGILIPRVTTTEREAIMDPADGQLVYDLTLDHFFYYSDITGSWRKIYVDDDSGSPSSGTGEVPHTPSYGADWNVRGNVGADIYSSDPPLLGNTDYKPIVFITDDLERLRITEDGEVKIAGDLEVGQDLTVKKNVFLNTEGGSTTIHGPVQMDMTLNVDGATTLNNTLDVDGATTLNNTLDVDGATTLNDDLTVTGMSSTHLTGTLDVDKTLNVDGATTLQSSLDVNNMAPTHLTGNLNVDKDVTIGGDLVIEDDALIKSSLTIQTNFTTTGTLGFNDYPVQISGGNNGIAIATSRNPANSNAHFMSFWNAAGEMVGRIEGQTAADVVLPGLDDAIKNLFDGPDEVNSTVEPDTVSADNTGANSASTASDFAASMDMGATFNAAAGQNPGVDAKSEFFVEVILLAIELAGAVIELASSFASILDPEDIFIAALNLAIAIANLAVYIGFAFADIGVTYESGEGDYAEWLPKYKIEEVMTFGDVVGVNGGKISKTYVLADHYMVVSAAPVLLGKMPNPDDAAAYEKVAFMGQVPVKVRGEVHIGDYILPSGDGDGLAIAVSKEKMRAKDYARVVGVAWDETDGKENLYEMINTAIGINTNDMANIIDKMQVIMNQMQAAIKEVNPAFQMHLFNVDEGVVVNDLDYSVSSTHTSQITNHFAGKNFSTPEEALDLVEEALRNEGVNIDEYPVMSKLLNDPNYAPIAKDYYSNVMADLMSIVEEYKAAGSK